MRASSLIFLLVAALLPPGALAATIDFEQFAATAEGTAVPEIAIGGVTVSFDNMYVVQPEPDSGLLRFVTDDGKFDTVNQNAIKNLLGSATQHLPAGGVTIVQHDNRNTRRQQPGQIRFSTPVSGVRFVAVDVDSHGGVATIST